MKFESQNSFFLIFEILNMENSCSFYDMQLCTISGRIQGSVTGFMVGLCAIPILCAGGYILWTDYWTRKKQNYNQWHEPMKGCITAIVLTLLTLMSMLAIIGPTLALWPLTMDGWLEGTCQIQSIHLQNTSFVNQSNFRNYNVGLLIHSSELHVGTMTKFQEEGVFQNTVPLNSAAISLEFIQHCDLTTVLIGKILDCSIHKENSSVSEVDLCSTYDRRTGAIVFLITSTILPILLFLSIYVSNQYDKWDKKNRQKNYSLNMETMIFVPETNLSSKKDIEMSKYIKHTESNELALPLPLSKHKKRRSSRPRDRKA
jgi:hypothetical protein